MKKNVHPPAILSPQTRFAASQRSTFARFTLHQTLQLGFTSAVHSVEYHALTDPRNLIRHFDNSFELVAVQYCHKRDLEESGRLTELAFVDQRFYRLTKQDLFDALKPTTQQLLIQLGLKL